MSYFIWHILFFRVWELGVAYSYAFKYCSCFENCRHSDMLAFNYNYLTMSEIDRAQHITLDATHSKNQVVP